jgi:hypothetical protein
VVCEEVEGGLKEKRRFGGDSREAEEAEGDLREVMEDRGRSEGGLREI